MNRRTIFLNGLFTNFEGARVSVFDRGFCYGDGLFETLRACGSAVFQLGRHLDRLYAAAESIYLEIPMTRGEMTDALRQTLERSGEKQAIVRLALSRGEQAPGLMIDPEAVPTVVISARPFRPPPAQSYKGGVKVVLVPGLIGESAGESPLIKSANYLRQIILRERARRQGAEEGLAIDSQDRLTEGSASNVFAVTDGEILTPPVGPWVLPGVTREVVLDIGRREGLTMREEPIDTATLMRAREVFITNTRIGILPVTRIGETAVGPGVPGPVTRRLGKQYAKTVEAEIEKC